MRALVIVCFAVAVLPLVCPKRGAASEQLTASAGPSVARRIVNPSRSVHPAEECYRATGWQVRPLPMRLSQGYRWGCFEARQSERVEVCQTYVDSRGRSWSDAGSWWWAALLRRTDGPWTALTAAAAIP
jgi:hypothetical protein